MLSFCLNNCKFLNESEGSDRTIYLSLHMSKELLNLPCRKDGNPFNTTIPPSSAPASLPSPLFGAPVPSSNHPANNSLPEKNGRKPTTRVIIYAAVAVASFILAMLIIISCISKWCKKQKDEELLGSQKGKGSGSLKGSMSNASLIMPNTDIKKEGKSLAVFLCNVGFHFVN